MPEGFSYHSGRSEDFLFRPAPGPTGYLIADPLPALPADADEREKHDEGRREGAAPD